MAQLDLNQNHLNNLRPVNPDFAEDLTGLGAVARPYADATQDKFDTEASMDTALGAAGYTADQLATMTQNDKVYALRLVNSLVK